MQKDRTCKNFWLNNRGTRSRKCISINLAEQKAQLDDRFLRGRQMAFMICEFFRVTSAHEAKLEYSDLFDISLHGDDVQEFDTR